MATTWFEKHIVLSGDKLERWIPGCLVWDVHPFWVSAASHDAAIHIVHHGVDAGQDFWGCVR